MTSAVGGSLIGRFWYLGDGDDKSDNGGGEGVHMFISSKLIYSFLFPVTKLVFSWNVSSWQIWVAERNIRFLLYFCKVLCHNLHI